MSKRAEFRRQQKYNSKTYNLTQQQIDQIKEDAKQEAMDNAFKMMLSIPSYVLSENDWKKTSDKRIPVFIDNCLLIYEDVVSGKRSFKELIDYVEKKGQILITNK